MKFKKLVPIFYVSVFLLVVTSFTIFTAINHSTKRIVSTRIEKVCDAEFTDVIYDDGSRTITIDYGNGQKKDVITYDPKTKEILCNGKKAGEVTNSINSNLIVNSTKDVTKSSFTLSWRYFQPILQNIKWLNYR